MLEFERMVKSVREYGMIKNPPKPVISKNNEKFFETAEKCQVFIFHQEGGIKEIDESEDDFNEEPFLLKSAPFSIFSIEMNEGFVSVPREDAELDIFIRCIFCVEVDPMKYDTYISIGSGKLGEKSSVFRFNTPSVMRIVEEFVERINREKSGYEKTKVRIKIGTGNKKRLHKIKNVIHIAPNNVTERKNSFYTGKNIDWTHKWSVRGHWRKHNGLGKDRSGERCVEGFTWVKEHEKGPDIKEKVMKVRKVS